MKVPVSMEESVMFAGFSMGGYVDFEFLSQFPEPVNDFELFSILAGDDAPEVREEESIMG